jgi:hypothetical protein
MRRAACARSKSTSSSRGGGRELARILNDEDGAGGLSDGGGMA